VLKKSKIKPLGLGAAGAAPAGRHRTACCRPRDFSALAQLPEVWPACACVVKSAKAGLREQEVRRTEMLRAERRPVVQAKRSGEQLLASN